MRFFNKNKWFEPDGSGFNAHLEFLLGLVSFLSFLPLLVALLWLGPVVSVPHLGALHLVDEGDDLSCRLIFGSSLNEPE